MRKETFFIIIISLAALFFANSPIIYGYVFQKPELHYLGRKAINTNDTYTYIAFIEQARQGRLLLENLYTSDPQTPTLIRPLFVVLGFIAQFTGFSSVQAYMFAKLVLGIVFCFVLYHFLKRFFHGSYERVAAFSIVLFSTGLGYIFRFAFPLSSDLWIPESNTFLSLGEAPHFILSQTLMLLLFMFLIDGVEKRKYGNFFLASFCALILSLEHPFNIVTTFVVTIFLLCYFLYKKVLSKNLLTGMGIVLGAQIVGVLYQAYQTHYNSVLSSWQQNNQLPSPSPINFIVGFGLLLPFMFVGLERYLRQQNAYRLLLIFWAASSFVLLYSPLSFQRRISEGIHIPIAIMAAEGILLCAAYISSLVLDRLKNKLFNACVFGVIIFMSLGSFVIAFFDLHTVSSDIPSSYAYSLAQTEYAAMLALRSHTTFEDAILANSYYGNILPGITGRRVFAGHAVQTPNFEQKINQINAFLGETDNRKAYAFLKQNNITFIFLGINDGFLTYGFKPDAKPYLEKAYQKDGVTIYHVR